MKKLLIVLLLAASAAAAQHPDSVYLFSYATGKNGNHNGLHFAWSADGQQWRSIGNEFSFLRSDYGRWGSEKRMFSPFLLRAADGEWHCVWSVNAHDNQFAHASSKDLISWGRQGYPFLEPSMNFQRPQVLQRGADTYEIAFTSGQDGYSVGTRDFRQFTATRRLPSLAADRNQTISVDGNSITGQQHKVEWTMVEKLIHFAELKAFRWTQYGESTAQDAVRFAGLKPVDIAITAKPQQTKSISDLLLGIFFEDINYAADGGLYAELVQNRGFEYDPGDREHRDATWNSTHSWSGSFQIDSALPLHQNNRHYAVLRAPGQLQNGGFDGMVIRKGERYNFSFFARSLNGTGGKAVVSLVDADGSVASATINVTGGGWKKYAAVLSAPRDVDSAVLRINFEKGGSLAFDMVSLFPANTFKGRPNGLRRDLAQTIADIHPRFIRFPGGCVAHGDGIDNIYQWKNSIGPIETRKGQRNLWGYHQSMGLGYFEYFQFCEDIGAAPLPVVAAGVPCQNSGTGGRGQQGGIPMDQMDEYVQDILDLIEYANGDAQSKWGRLRAQAGHPKPFGLKYIGIGNEDLITDVFEERFTMIYEAVRRKHPEITVIGTAGPFYEGTDYEEGWEIARRLNVPSIDEHYYNPPGWFINNQDFYDRYDRGGSKVYLGEYAAHLPGRPNNLETALAEALYLTSLERNGDVVSMASYAPLLAKEKHTQWNPDLIYFNNSEVKLTPGYEVQKLYGLNGGDAYVPSDARLSNQQDAVAKRIAYSIVRDSKTGDVVVKLVNLLPVAVRVELDLTGVLAGGKKGVRTVLTGKPADRNLKPQASAFDLGPKTTVELAPYSFTVLR